MTVLAGVLAVIFPGILQVAADFVGVDRGTDLLLYVLAVVVMYFVGSTSARFREQEARLVRLAREVALAECETRLVAGAQHSAPLSRPARPVRPGRALWARGPALGWPAQGVG